MQPFFGIAAPANWKPSQRPERSQSYLRFLRSQPCAVCGSTRGVEAAHSGGHGISQKADDFLAVPLCRRHHRTDRLSYHALGRKFFPACRLDVDALTRELRARFAARQVEMSGPACPACGETGGRLFDIEDRDESVGYRAEETVCTHCHPGGLR